jgi:hypothetical protein
VSRPGSLLLLHEALWRRWCWWRRRHRLPSIRAERGEGESGRDGTKGGGQHKEVILATGNNPRNGNSSGFFPRAGDAYPPMLQQCCGRCRGIAVALPGIPGDPFAPEKK